MGSHTCSLGLSTRRPRRCTQLWRGEETSGWAGHCRPDRLLSWGRSDCPTLFPGVFPHACPNTYLKRHTSVPCPTRLAHSPFFLSH